MTPQRKWSVSAQIGEQNHGQEDSLLTIKSKLGLPWWPVAKTMLPMQGASVRSLVRELLTSSTAKGSKTQLKIPSAITRSGINFFKGNIYYQWSLKHFLRITTRRWHIFPILNTPYPLLLSFLLPLLCSFLPLFFLLSFTSSSHSLTLPRRSQLGQQEAWHWECKVDKTDSIPTLGSPKPGGSRGGERS